MDVGTKIVFLSGLEAKMLLNTIAGGHFDFGLYEKFLKDAKLASA